MGHHWLHLIDASGLHTYLCKQASFASPTQHFAAGESGHATFKAWLAGTARRDIHRVLCDIADDSCVLDSIPHTRGADRQALLARKIARHFAEPHFAYASSLGRETQGRQDERILLSGLGSGAALAPWLDVLMASECLLHSIGSIAELGGQCLLPDTQPAFLLSWSPAGLRISLYKASRLYFSRLLQADTSADSGHGARCAQAVQQSLHYLHTQHLLNRHENLAVIVLGDAALARQIEDNLRDEPTLRLQHYALTDLAQRHALKYAELAHNSRPLFIQLACQRPRHAQLAPPPMRRNYQAHRIARAAHAMCALVLLASVCVAIWQLLSAKRIGQESQALQALASQYDQDYASWRAQLPSTPIAIEQITALHTEIQGFVHPQPSLQAALQHLAQALDGNPHISLLSLDWQHPPHTTEAPATRAELNLQARIGRDTDQGPQPSGTTWALAEQFRQALARSPGFDAQLQTRQAADDAGFRILVRQQEGS